LSADTVHPCDLGDLPAYVLYRFFTDFLPIKKESIRKNWRQRYPFFVRKREGLFIDVKAADLWLDQRGHKLLSQALLDKKRERNPDWVPAGEFIEAGATASISTAIAKATKLDFASDIEKLGGMG
jgi:hypothetical protein